MPGPRRGDGAAEPGLRTIPSVSLCLRLPDEAEGEVGWPVGAAVATPVAVAVVRDRYNFPTATPVH